MSEDILIFVDRKCWDKPYILSVMIYLGPIRSNLNFKTSATKFVLFEHNVCSRLKGIANLCSLYIIYIKFGNVIRFSSTCKCWHNFFPLLFPLCVVCVCVCVQVNWPKRKNVINWFMQQIEMAAAISRPQNSSNKIEEQQMKNECWCVRASVHVCGKGMAKVM